jgi:HAD superfamily hydrolase (TIGR01450 family)
MSRVGFVGLGGMGSRMARRLLDAGHAVMVWNRTEERAAPLTAAGGIVAATPAEAAARSEFLITMVANPAALRAVTEGSDGVAAGANESLTVLEMSTVGPAAIDRLASVLPAGTGLVDAPVLGSLREAEAGALTIFAGGATNLVHAAEPILSALGSPLHVGPLGSGARSKLVANSTLFGTLTAVGEAVALARALGLPDDATFRVLAATPLATQAERRRHAIETGDFEPRFSISLARKDADLILEAAVSRAELRIVDAARRWLVDAEAAGRGDDDYTAVLATILETAVAPAGGAPAVAPDPLAYDGLIIDLDGVVWLGGHPIDGAAEAIAAMRARGTRVLFLTNDPQSSREQHAARLTEIGIPATASDVVTSGAATARYLASQARLAGAGVLVVGSPALHDEIDAAGFELVPAWEAERARLVVVGGHEAFDYEELWAATTAVAGGAELVATGRDAVFPAHDGPRPATGAIVAAIETATGITATAIGKPERFMFDVAREALADCTRVAVIGDHLLSDIVGAKRAGLDAILVLTGTSSPDDLERAAVQPDLVLPRLGAFPVG